MALEDQKWWIIFVVAAPGNIQISPLTKITKLMPASCFHLSQHAENEMKSRKRWFLLAFEYRGILMGYLKLFRFMSVMMVQTKCKLNNSELFLKLFHIQCKLRNWKQQVLRRNNRTWKMAKWGFAWILTLERKWKTRTKCYRMP